MNKNEIERLLQQCRSILDTTVEEKSDTLTQGVDAVSLVKFLGNALNEHALTIIPQGNFVVSALSNNQKIAFAESLKLFQLILALSSQGGLKKPLVFLLPVVEAEKVTRWITCVILPKNYKAPAGKPTENTQGEVVYYLDASVTENSEVMPACFVVFYQLITKGFTQRIRQGQQLQMKFTAPCLPEGMFYNGSRKQQNSGEESFLWAAYNALRVVFEGSTEFANTFPEANSVINAKLNTLWHSLLVPTTAPTLKMQIEEIQEPSQKQAPSTHPPAVQILPDNHSSVVDDEVIPASKLVPVIEDRKEEIKQDTPTLTNSPKSKEATSSSSSPTPSQVSSPTISHLPEKETKEEKSNSLPNLPAYDFKTIYTVLHAYDVPTSLKELCATTHTQEWDTLIQSPSSITREFFLKENLDYLLSRNEKAGNRRLCLLLTTSRGTVLSIIFEYSGWLPTSAEQWRHFVAQRGWVTSDEILTSSEAINHARRLYTLVRCTILSVNGSEPEQVLIQSLIEPLARAFDVTPQFNFHYFQSTLAFTDACRKLMIGKFNTTETPDLLSVFQQHQLQCITVLMDKLNKVTPVSLREKIFKHLTAMSKYMLIESTRRQQEIVAGEQLISSLTKIETLLLQGRMIKRFYYQRLTPLKECLKLLDFSKVILLLKLLETSPEGLEQQLMAARNTQKETLKEWENKWKAQKKTLDRHWMPHLTFKGKKSLSFLYRHSSVGLGGDLCGIVAQGIANETKEDIFFTEIKTHLQKIVKTNMHRITRSSQWADRSSDIAGKLLSESNVIFSVRVTGASLAALYTLWNLTEFYGPARPVMVGVFSFLLSEFAQFFEKIDDENARVVSAGKGVSYLSQHTVAFRTVSLIICLMETAYTRNPYYLVGGVGGMSGTFLLTIFVQKELKDRPKKPLKEEEALMLFLASQFGYAMGQYIFGSFYATISRKVESREQALNYLRAFEDMEYQELNIQLPSMLMHPRLWFNYENPLSMDWQGYDGFYYHRECQVYEIPPMRDIRIGVLHCGQITQHHPRLAMVPWDSINELPVCSVTYIGLSSTNVLVSGVVSTTLATVGMTFFFKRDAKRTLKEIASTREGKKKNLYPIAKEIFEHIHITGCLGRLTPQTAQRFIVAIQSVITELEKQGVDVDVEKMKQEDQQRLCDEIIHQIRLHAKPHIKRCSLARVWQFFSRVIDPVLIENKAEVIAVTVHRQLSGENNREVSENLPMRNLTT